MVPTYFRFQLPTPREATPAQAAGSPVLVRCDHCEPRQTEQQHYLHAHEAELKKEKMLVCGARGCARLATMVWLSENEEQRYLSGERTFRLARSATRVLVK